MDTTTTSMVGLQSRPDKSRSRLFGHSAGGRIMREALQRHFDGPQVTTALTMVELVLDLYQHVASAVVAGWNWVIRHCVVSIEISYAGEVKQQVLTYVGDKVLAKRHHGDLVAHLASRVPGDDYDFVRFTSSRGLQFVPKFRSVWFLHKGRLINVSSSDPTTCDENVNGYGHYAIDLHVMCLGVSSQPIVDFFNTCRSLYVKERESLFTTFVNTNSGQWIRAMSKKPRPLSSVHLVESVKEELVADIRKYLDANTKRRYAVRKIPYRRGYLFHGPPGTGKSTLSEAIAGVFQLNIYAIDLSSVQSDQDLARLFQCLSQRCIVLLEDIDASGLVRDKAAAAASSSQPQPPATADNKAKPAAAAPSGGPHCTLSGLLQALDGVGSQEGRIVIMTTNRPEDLDEALIRPGRVDKKVRLGRADRDCARDMFIRMFEPNIATSSSIGHDGANDSTIPGENALNDMTPTCCDLCPTLDMETVRALAAKFARRIPEDTFSPGQLQGFFQMHLECPQSAIAQVTDWIEQEKHPQFEEVRVRRIDIPESVSV